MENFIAAAISSRNVINRPDESIANMRKWTTAAKGQGAELVLYPELNVRIIEREADSMFSIHVLVHGSGVIGKQRKIHVLEQEKPYWIAGDSIQVFDIGKAKHG